MRHHKKKPEFQPYSRGELVVPKGLIKPLGVCRVCGCHDTDACFHPDLGNCWWVEPDLCSHCKLKPGEAKRYSVLYPEYSPAIDQMVKESQHAWEEGARNHNL